MIVNWDRPCEDLHWFELNWRYLWCLKVRDMYIKTKGFFIYTSLHLLVLLKILFSVILLYTSQKGSITQNMFSLRITLNIDNSVKLNHKYVAHIWKQKEKVGRGRKPFVCLMHSWFWGFIFFSGLSVGFSQIIVNFDAWFPFELDRSKLLCSDLIC